MIRFQKKEKSMIKMNKEYIEGEYNQAIKEFKKKSLKKKI